MNRVVLAILFVLACLQGWTQGKPPAKGPNDIVCYIGVALRPARVYRDKALSEQLGALTIGQHFVAVWKSATIAYVISDGATTEGYVQLESLTSLAPITRLGLETSIERIGQSERYFDEHPDERDVVAAAALEAESNLWARAYVMLTPATDTGRRDADEKPREMDQIGPPTLTLKNDTKYRTRIVLAGPRSRVITLAPGEVQKVILAAGTYTEHVSALGGKVKPLTSSLTLKAGSDFRVTYYIVSKPER